MNRQVIQTKKINNETLDLNNTIDLKDVYREFHHAKGQHTFFSQQFMVLYQKKKPIF
jgi:hypothetical protein